METKAFLLKEQGDWALISVIESSNITVMINSSLGAWCYTWGSPGDDKIQFLETADEDYTFGKFSNTIKLGLPQKWQKQEFEFRYKHFYRKFWSLLIAELKK